MFFEFVIFVVLECDDMEKLVRRLGRECDGSMMFILGKSYKEIIMGVGY